MDSIVIDKTFSIIKKSGRFMLCDSTGDEQAVKIVWARPITGKGKDIAFINDEKKCIAMIPSLDVIDKESQDAIVEALAIRYIVPQIKAVQSTREYFGTIFWEVETNFGPKQFAMRATHRNVFHVAKDHLFLRDVIGNLYEIVSLDALDVSSKKWISNVV